MHEVDQAVEPRGGDALMRGSVELRRALDACDPAAERLREKDCGPAASGRHVQHVRLRPEPEPLAEQPDLLRAGRVLEVVPALDDAVKPRHRLATARRRARG